MPALITAAGARADGQKGTNRVADHTVVVSIFCCRIWLPLSHPAFCRSGSFRLLLVQIDLGGNSEAAIRAFQATPSPDTEPSFLIAFRKST